MELNCIPCSSCLLYILCVCRMCCIIVVEHVTDDLDPTWTFWDSFWTANW